MTLEIPQASSSDGLRLERLPGDRWRLKTGNRPRLWARQRSLTDVDVLLADDPQPLLPPISAPLARSLVAGVVPVREWTWLLERLLEGPAALPAGSWLLRPLDLRRFSLVEPVARLYGTINGPEGDVCGDLIPTRPPMPGDASRLKALQKRAREGVLTPALVLHVTGLQVYLVLDGHLRLLAGAPALEVCRLEGHQEPTPLNLDALAEAQARLRAQGRLNAATEQAWQHSVVGLSVPKPISGPPHARWCWDVGTWDAEVRQREAALLEPLPALWDGLLDPDEAL